MSHGFDKVLPDRILKMVDPRDRHLVPGKTQDEVMSLAKVKVERDLHDMIESLLRRLDVVYIHSRMDRKTTIGVGLPDFMFALGIDVSHPLDEKACSAVAIEVKLPGEDLDDDQKRIRKAMMSPPNSWRYYVVRSYDEALAVVRDAGFAI